MNISNNANKNTQANLQGIARTLVLADVIEDEVANQLNDVAKKEKDLFHCCAA